MKYVFMLICSVFVLSAQGQIAKKTNTIEVYGLTFKEAANGLMDAGYTLEKVDSNFNTMRTDFKDGTGKNKWMKMRISVRVKDSVAVVTGDWYNSMFIGAKLLGVEQTVENSIVKIEYTYGNPKACFKEMDAFALSFKKPVRYFIKP